MERQTKNRILGILVLVGLVIIALPFLQTRNELPSETALVKAPAFPDQTVQTTINEPSDTKEDIATADTIATSDVIPFAVTTAPLVTPVPDKNEPQDTVNLNQATITRIEEPALLPVAEPEIQAKPVAVEAIPEGSIRDTAEPAVAPVSTAPKHVKHKALHVVKKSRARTLDGYQVLDPADLKLKPSAWVVQVGSFKSKSNAMKLVNTLRTRGYRSFIEQASSNQHGLTKVLVGPENKKAGAHLLASKLENEVHVRGIVVNYKPLSL